MKKIRTIKPAAIHAACKQQVSAFGRLIALYAATPHLPMAECGVSATIAAAGGVSALIYFPQAVRMTAGHTNNHKRNNSA